jgi:hypothetical protein
LYQGLKPSGRPKDPADFSWQFGSAGLRRTSTESRRKRNLQQALVESLEQIVLEDEVESAESPELAKCSTEVGAGTPWQTVWARSSNWASAAALSARLG